MLYTVSPKVFNYYGWVSLLCVEDKKINYRKEAKLDKNSVILKLDAISFTVDDILTPGNYYRGLSDHKKLKFRQRRLMNSSSILCWYENGVSATQLSHRGKLLTEMVKNNVPIPGNLFLTTKSEIVWVSVFDQKHIEQFES